MLILYLLSATTLNASHGYKVSKCHSKFQGEHIEKKDKVKVLISTNQTGDFDPTKITNSSERLNFFSNWKAYRNVKFGYGLGAWGILHKWSEKKLLVIRKSQYYPGSNRPRYNHEISWHDKNGKVWESDGVLHKSNKDNIIFSWGCRYVNDGMYSKRFMHIYYGHVDGFPGHFAAIIDFTRYYKINKPSF